MDGHRMVRFRVAKADHQHACDLLLKLDAHYQIHVAHKIRRSDFGVSKCIKNRIVWQQDRKEQWARLVSQQEGIDFVTALLHDGKIYAHNI